jgi:hypothetical protein
MRTAKFEFATQFFGFVICIAGCSMVYGLPAILFFHNDFWFSLLKVFDFFKYRNGKIHPKLATRKTVV